MKICCTFWNKYRKSKKSKISYAFLKDIRLLFTLSVVMNMKNISRRRINGNIKSYLFNG